MKRNKLRKSYFILLYTSLIFLSISMYLYISVVSKENGYYCLYLVVILVLILSLYQFKAYIYLDDNKIIRYTGFKSFGNMEISLDQIEKVDFKVPIKQIIVYGKNQQIMIFTNSFQNFMVIGKSIYENTRRKGLNIYFSDKFIKHFIK